MGDISLSELYSRALSAASKAYDLPTMEDSTQDVVQASLADLRLLEARGSALALFSPNERVDDVATRDLLYLLVPFVMAEVEGRIRAVEREPRLAVVAKTIAHIKAFLSLLENYNIVPEDERALHEWQTGDAVNPAQRRELKIKQYKKEKELNTRIEVLRKRRRTAPVETNSATIIDLVASLLPKSPSTSSSMTTGEDDSDSDPETDDLQRETSLILLRLAYAQAQTQLESTEQELTLLRMAPPSPVMLPGPHTDGQDRRREQRNKEDNEMWKLDAPKQTEGPLLDPSGKPLRPFTILPSGAGDRARFQAQVFQPDHNLPSMSIDEYLEIEKQRGSILTGGGPASEAEPTSSEQLALDAEQDGTIQGGEKEEEKRQKDEKWAHFTDNNARGAGNRLNRG